MKYLRSVLCQSIIATVCIGFSPPCFSERLDFKVLHVPNTPRADSAEHIVIRSTEEWVAYWNRGQKERTSPPINIDFSQFTLIIATLGKTGNSTLGVYFLDIYDRPDGVFASTVDMDPGEDCVRMSQTGYPRALALIPRTSKPVRFNVSKAVQGCTPGTTFEADPASSKLAH